MQTILSGACYTVVTMVGVVMILGQDIKLSVALRELKYLFLHILRRNDLDFYVRALVFTVICGVMLFVKSRSTVSYFAAMLGTMCLQVLYQTQIRPRVSRRTRRKQEIPALV